MVERIEGVKIEIVKIPLTCLKMKYNLKVIKMLMNSNIYLFYFLQL
jgi:hypothetical protein